MLLLYNIVPAFFNAFFLFFPYENILCVTQSLLKCKKPHSIFRKNVVFYNWKYFEIGVWVF